MMADYIFKVPCKQVTVDASELIAKSYATSLVPDNIGVITGIQVGGETSIMRDKVAHEVHDEIAELRDMIERLRGKPYYMKIQCHNCGAPLVIDSSDHLIKCRYCHTAYFSGTQLVNSNI